MTAIDESSLDERIEFHKKVIAELFTEYGITSASTAHEDIRSRFSQADLEIYKESLAYLHGVGALE